MANKIRISMVGCCLVDRLYNNISFSDSTFTNYLSKNSGDGGLTPGQLVFKEEFEKYAQKDFLKALREITKEKDPDKINIGGPGVVPLIHISQMLDPEKASAIFMGVEEKDSDGEYILSTLKQMNLTVENYQLINDQTPATDVLSDPQYDNGNGERIFINSIGAAWNFSPSDLDDDFFKSEVVVFGGTALVPTIHDNLTELLTKSKSEGCTTIVNTVYDFRNEKANPSKRWPLGNSDISYQYIDLLITDLEEALRLSGESTLDSAISFFKEKGAKAVIVTNGSRNISLYATKESLFQELVDTEMPVSRAVSKALKREHIGDTTGCGDNFVGGVVASLVDQIQNKNEVPNLKEASTWGIVSGGYSCFYIGGTYIENKPGEKRSLITPFIINTSIKNRNET